MYIIIGLGNPESKYDGTRHNIGFECIDYIAEKNNILINCVKHKALCGSGYIEGNKVLLAKPITYMNLSGESVRQLIDYYKIPVENIIIIYDDISLDVGNIRIKKKGSAGGHNGIKSIIQHLGTQEFGRIKIGVGNNPAGWDLADYVLGKFSKDEIDGVRQAIEVATMATCEIVGNGIDSAMNKYNKRN